MAQHTTADAPSPSSHLEYGTAITIRDGKPCLVPSSPSQAAFLESVEPEVIYNSDVGGGKSLSGCGAIHGEAIRYAGSHHLVLRATQVSCVTTTMQVYRNDLLGPSAFDARHSMPDGQHILTYPNGSVVYFAGLDDPTKWQSGAFGSAFIDELVAVLAGGRGVSEAEWETVGMRLRDPKALIHRLLGACNAGGRRHWIPRRAASGRLRLIRALPGENDKNLPQDYVARKRAMRGVHRRRYVDNEWCDQEGLVFSSLSDRHVCEVPAPVGLDVPIGVDFGYNHAFACVLGWPKRVSDHDVQWRIFDVIKGGRGVGLGSRTTEDWARILDSRWPGLRYMPAYCDHDPDAQVTLQRHCPSVLSCVNASKADELASINTVLALLDRTLPGGEPAIVFDSVRCAPLLDEMSEVAWQIKRDGTVIDKPADINNDACDAMRYLLHSHSHNTAAKYATVVTSPDQLVGGGISVWGGGAIDEDSYEPPDGEILIGGTR